MRDETIVGAAIDGLIAIVFVGLFVSIKRDHSEMKQRCHSLFSIAPTEKDSLLVASSVSYCADYLSQANEVRP